MTDDALVARALREVADVLAGEAKLYSGTHHGDIINNTAIGFRARAAALDAGGREKLIGEEGPPPPLWAAPQPAREGGEKRPPWLTCHDCGLPYSDDGFCDFVVPDDVWARICPEGGVLCAVCMCRRAARAGVRGADGEFTSGPFTPRNGPPSCGYYLSGQKQPGTFCITRAEREEFLRLREARKAADAAAISKQPDVMGGEPVIAGTRIPSAAIRRFAEAGYNVAGIREEYPALTEAQIAAALAYEFRHAARVTDGVTLTREEVEELIEMLADNGYGRAVRKLRARAQLGEKP